MSLLPLEHGIKDLPHATISGILRRSLGLQGFESALPVLSLQPNRRLNSPLESEVMKFELRA